MQNVYIVKTKRTPIGSFGGQFLPLSAVDLGAKAVNAVLNETQIDPTVIDELFFGNVCQANLGQAPATQILIKAGLPDTIPATLVNKVCASGLKATIWAAQTIQAGVNHVVISGGTESMSNIPFYLEKARFGYGYGSGTLVDGLERDGLRDAYNPIAMGCFADATAEKYTLSREMQDNFAIESYKRAAAAWQNGHFANEVVPIELTDKKGNTKTIGEDEEFKKVNFEKIPTLKPTFTKNGTVTAANASSINDGAAALLIVSEEALTKYNLKPIARIVSYADAAHEPEWFTTAPVKAAEMALKRANLSIDAIDYFEVNEAFSAVVLAFMQAFSVPHEKVNIWGGAVAIGHPLGCSGARILTTLTNVLQSNAAKYGMAAICNGGGGASAMIIERM